MVWSLVGFVLALVLAAAGVVRSRGLAGYYDGEVYGMTPKAHFGYACAGAGFASIFALTLAFRSEIAAIVALALFAVVAIFYGASFLRGADDE
jgi:hypothetical protein